ncbi:hypothetical protein MC7420_393 [Coleofasciculus chthonoplastes PCC 7420]|uniref:Uncharacterized protein n=1 Tax=Coleofasciculus chthonoplastes PCC 7420 TaxID=118168 RepID=B4VL74_9CYAN|nr:hypothetical protein MC7420_393 [Coleofasciculus chthonoplastes PCC 7420]
MGAIPWRDRLASSALGKVGGRGDRLAISVFVERLSLTIIGYGNAVPLPNQLFLRWGRGTIPSCPDIDSG